MKLYKNKDWLYQKYIKERLSAFEMVKLIKCGNSTISRWLRKFGIPTRTQHEAMLEVSKQGKLSWWKGKTGENHPTWKGGQIVKGKGYIYIRMPEHPQADPQGYIRRSYLVAEKMLKRSLYPNEIIHHKNGTRDDDRPGNIFITNRERHMDFHRATNGRFVRCEELQNKKKNGERNAK